MGECFIDISIFVPLFVPPLKMALRKRAGFSPFAAIADVGSR
jgi:hypothetical protein